MENSIKKAFKRKDIEIADVICIGDTQVHYFCFPKNGAPVDLSDKEIDMLIFLAKNRGKPISPRELYENVWEDIALASSNNTVTVHILNLRRKLEDDTQSPKLIRTIWGKGYQID